MRPGVSLSLLTDGDLTSGFEADIDELGFVPAIYSPDYDLVTSQMIGTASEMGVRIIPENVSTVAKNVGLMCELEGWSRDGRELFFLGADGFLHAVEIRLGEEPEIGRPEPLFHARMRFGSGDHYDVTPDGQTFVINSWMEDTVPRPMSVVLNWKP